MYENLLSPPNRNMSSGMVNRNPKTDDSTGPGDGS